MTRKLALAVAAIFLLVGCGGAPIEDGYIKQKKFTPAHWEGGWDYYDVPEYSCVTNYEGKQECGIKMVQRSRWDPEHEHYEDRWEFQLEQCKTDDKGKEHCRKGWIDVDEETFHEYRRNAHYPDAR